jgi:hypothetical protein
MHSQPFCSFCVFSVYRSFIPCMVSTWAISFRIFLKHIVKMENVGNILRLICLHIVSSRIFSVYRQSPSAYSLYVTVYIVFQFWFYRYTLIFIPHIIRKSKFFLKSSANFTYSQYRPKFIPRITSTQYMLNFFLRIR